VKKKAAREKGEVKKRTNCEGRKWLRREGRRKEERCLNKAGLRREEEGKSN
jgi:hypothetical protein